VEHHRVPTPGKQVLTRDAILIIQQLTMLPTTVPVDMMATLKDTSTTTDQDDGGEEPVKNQAELVTLEEYYV